jgi:hypothetical protein
MRRIVLALAVMAPLAFTTSSVQAHPGLFGHHGYGFGQYGHANYAYRGIGPSSFRYAAPIYRANYGYGFSSGYGINVGVRGVGASIGTSRTFGYGYGNYPGLGW